MIIILASRLDAPARRLVDAWSAYDARLMTPADLSSAGWCHRLGDPGPEVAVVGGQRVAVERIEGVLTRLPSVWPDEAGHVALEDREYVASEMTAFLSSWLSRLTCPVINRPGAISLMGPAHTPERWIALAARVGLRLPWTRRRFPPGPDAVALPPPGAITVTVLGDRCFGVGEGPLAEGARRLIAAAGAELGAVQFSDATPEARWVGAHLWPDLAVPELAAALLARFAPQPRSLGALGGVQ